MICVVGFVKFDKRAVVPTKGTSEASGHDLFMLLPEHLAPDRALVLFDGETAKLSTGIGLELPSMYEAQIRPRSSWSAKGVHVAFGTVDQDYRGEIKVVVTNNSGKTVALHNYTKIAQLVIQPVINTTFVEIDSLSETARGSNGFGSTGQ